MATLSIVHRTTYVYSAPVALGPHRLMLRPRESRDLQLLSFDLTITPQATVTWAHDVNSNAVASACFAGLSDRLTIESRALIELDAVAWPVFDIAAGALGYPFAYDRDDTLDLGALALPCLTDPDGRLTDWARGFVRGSRTDTLSLLKDLNAGVAARVAYTIREEEGVQTPLQTLDRGVGSCRDLALLFAEAARALGFGARLASGYLHDAGRTLTGTAGAGSTHAWAEIYLPGPGWIAFDPTNRALGGFNLIPVAVVRDLRQAAPVAGAYAGPPDALCDLAVMVEVSAA